MTQGAPHSGEVPLPDDQQAMPEVQHTAEADRADISAGNSTTQSKPKLPEDGTERLKPYRWKKGCPSPNPAGRPPRHLPLSGPIRQLMDMRMPQALRTKLELAIGQPLPKKVTWGEGLAIGTLIEAMGTKVGTDGMRLEFVKEARLAAEGASMGRILESQEEAAEAASAEDSASNVDRLYVAMLQMARKRADLYGMQMRRLEALETEARAEADRMAQQEQQKRSSSRKLEARTDDNGQGQIEE